METLFEGRDVKVALSAVAAAPCVVVTFSNFTGNKGHADYFGEGYLERRGFSVIYVVANQSRWWQTVEMAPAIDAARVAAAALGVDVVTYGASMGAYGALLYAGDLGATRVIAASPQVTLGDPSILQQDWLDVVRAHPIVRDDIVASLPPDATISVLYDPLDRRDAAHIRLLEDACAARGIVLHRYLVPFGTHLSLQFLSLSGILSDVIGDLLKGKMTTARFRDKLRAVRPSVERYRTQLALCLDRRRNRATK